MTDDNSNLPLFDAMRISVIAILTPWIAIVYTLIQFFPTWRGPLWITLAALAFVVSACAFSAARVRW